nr:carbohydrate kinase family protein [uncultured Lichenicoccus sp.]
MRPRRLVCLGNLTLDDLVQPDGSEQLSCVGGDALYGALAARLVLDQVDLVAPIGNDLPRHVQRMIEDNDFSFAGLPRRDRPTLRNRVVYQTSDVRDVTLLSDEADFEILSPRTDDVPNQFFDAGAFMILAMTLDAQRDLVTGCRRRRGSELFIGLDPQEEYIEGNVAEILSIVAAVDVFMPSLGEVGRLLGHQDPARATRELAALGPSQVVIKLGSAGSLAYNSVSGEEHWIAACPSPVVDTTGCGDAYCSAFLASLLSDPDGLRAAAQCGAVAASFAIESFGPTGLFEASRSRFEQRLRNFVNVTSLRRA